MVRLPQLGGDHDNWGSLLNEYLSQIHNDDGTLKENSVTSSAIAPGAVTKAAVGLDNVDNKSAVELASDTAFSTTYTTKALPGDITGNGEFNPNTSIYNLTGSNLRATRAALGRAISGTGLCEILCAGPSTTEGYPGQPAATSYPLYLTTLLGLRGYTAGSGWVHTSLNQAASRLDSRWTFSSGFTKFTSFKASSVYSKASGAVATFTSSDKGPNLDFVITGAYGTFTFAIDGGASAFSYKINNGTAVNVPAGGTASVAKGGVSTAPNIFAVTGLPAGTTHKLVITTTSTTAIYVMKARVYNAAAGVLVTNAGFGGSQASEWDLTTDADNNYGLQPSSVIGSTPQLVIFDATIWVNDYNMSAMTSTGYSAALTRIVQQYQARGCDVVLLSASAPSATVSYSPWAAFPDATYQSYRQVIYDVADSTDVPLIDDPDRDGDWAAANANKLMVDAYHKAPAGYAAVARAVDVLLAS